MRACVWWSMLRWLFLFVPLRRRSFSWRYLRPARRRACSRIGWVFICCALLVSVCAAVRYCCILLFGMLYKFVSGNLANRWESGLLDINVEKVYLTLHLSYMVYFTPQLWNRLFYPLNFSKPSILPPGQFFSGGFATVLYIHCVDLLMWSPIKLDFSMIFQKSTENK